MTLEELLRSLLPAVLALIAAAVMDRMLEARSLLPPGFREPWRRGAGAALVALILWIASFAALGDAGQAAPPRDLSQITTPQLFLLHGLLVVTIEIWFLLGFAGVPSPPRPPSPASPSPSPGEGGDLASEGLPESVGAPSLFHQFLAQFGLLAPNVPREIGLGVFFGIASWGAVILVAMVAAGILYAFGGEQALPKQPPALIPFLAALPFGLRLAISLSAGVVEETFFRGFLQPRIGIILSTLLFVMAHFSYGQPFMLVGITVLSFLYALLVKWRQTIWPAIAAHALFDGVQLLVVIPVILKVIDKEGVKALSVLGLLAGCGN